MTDERDYLVCCSLSFGCGSWSRDKDLEAAIERCRRIVYSDWKHMFKLTGEKVMLTLFDVTGQDRVTMDGFSVTGDHPDIPIKNLGTRTVTMPKGKR